MNQPRRAFQPQALSVWRCSTLRGSHAQGVLVALDSLVLGALTILPRFWISPFGALALVLMR